MKTRLLILAAALCLGAGSEALGAINDWTAIGPAGGYINRIVFNRSTPSTVYAIAAGGFYRSQNAGVSWTLIKSDFLNAPQGLAIDPSDATRVYVVAPNYPGLYMSTDGGASIAAVATLPTAVTSPWQVAVSANGATLYVNSGLRIFRSTDRAGTWTERTAVGNFAQGQVWTLAIDPSDANTVYAIALTSATGSTTLVTHDGAMTWQPLTVGDESTTSQPRDLAVNAANPNQIWTAHDSGVWVSNNKGVNWTNVSAAGTSTIAMDPSRPATLYAGTLFGQVFRTTDGGTTWTDVTGNSTVGQFSTIAFDPVQSTHLLVGGTNGVAATTTSGTQWSPQTSGLNSTYVMGLSADKIADRIYMNVYAAGIYYSAAGAASTVAVNNVGSSGLLQLSSQPNLSVMAVLAQPGRLSASLTDGLARSFDGGTTWSSLVPVAPPGLSSQITSFASSPAASQTILAVVPSGLYQSTNGGDLWVQAGTGLPAGANVGGLVAADSDPMRFYGLVQSAGGLMSYGVYRSSDAGMTFEPANSGIASSEIDALAVDPTNADIVYTATQTALLKSLDGGASWNPMKWDVAAANGYPIGFAIDPSHPSILYAASGAWIGRSADGGSSWQALRAASALPLWTSHVMLVDPNRPENILVTTLGSGVQQFTVAPDLSLTLAAPPSPVAVGASANYVYTLSNLGPLDATGARVSVQLPATAQNISAAASGGTCTVAATVAACVFAIARTGASTAITIAATAPAAGPMQLTASVAGDQPDSNPANNTVATTQSVVYMADVSVTATGAASAHTGDAVSYSVVVANAGPNIATATQLKFQLASGLTPGSASVTGATCSSSAGLYTCAVGDLAVSKSVTVTIAATAAAAGTQVSTATVITTAKDLNTANNSATSTTAVTPQPPPTQPPAASSGGGGSFSITYLLMLGFILAIRALRARRLRI
jgi:uncharacterized repeat protein (TIGR01451 family)